MESIFPQKQEDKVGTWLLYTWVYKIKNKSEGINVESACPFYNKAFSFSSAVAVLEPLLTLVILIHAPFRTIWMVTKLSSLFSRLRSINN